MIHGAKEPTENQPQWRHWKATCELEKAIRSHKNHDWAPRVLDKYSLEHAETRFPNAPHSYHAGIMKLKDLRLRGFTGTLPMKYIDMREFNEKMRKVERDYRVKAAQSERDAAEVILPSPPAAPY